GAGPRGAISTRAACLEPGGDHGRRAFQLGGGREAEMEGPVFPHRCDRVCRHVHYVRWRRIAPAFTCCAGVSAGESPRALLQCTARIRTLHGDAGALAVGLSRGALREPYGRPGRDEGELLRGGERPAGRAEGLSYWEAATLSGRSSLNVSLVSTGTLIEPPFVRI